MKKPMVACALALMSFSFAATADELKLGDQESPHLNVPYGDLNMSNPVGAQTMLQRINFAATRACGGKPDLREMEMFRIFRTCARAAKDDAVRQLNMPLVTSLWTEEKAKEDKLASAD